MNHFYIETKIILISILFLINPTYFQAGEVVHATNMKQVEVKLKFSSEKKKFEFQIENKANTPVSLDACVEITDGGKWLEIYSDAFDETSSKSGRFRKLKSGETLIGYFKADRFWNAEGKRTFRIVMHKEMGKLIAPLLLGYSNEITIDKSVLKP